MAIPAPPQVVRGITRTPLPYGLFSVLGLRDPGEDRWESGVIFESPTCDPVGGLGAADCEPYAPADTEADPPTERTGTLGLPKELSSNGGPLGEGSPFTVYGHHNCSPVGTDPIAAQGLASVHLIAREEARVEQALWTGDLGNVPNFAGANGYAAPSSVGTFAPWRAVSALEQAIAETYGAQGTLHMDRELASRLAKEGSIEARGGRLFTALGTPIVAGTGYGSGRIVATSPLLGYRSEVFTSSDRPGDLLDRATNDLYAIAERTYLLGIDPCLLLEASITPDPDPEPID